MKTYQQLLQDYKQPIYKAIESYEHLFSDKNPMQVHRANDVETLKTLLREEKNSTRLKVRLEKTLEDFKTGFAFIKTGRSKLRDRVQATLERPGFSEKDFLLARIYELELQVKQPLQYKPDASLNEASETLLREQLMKANITISELQEEIKELKEKITLLEKENKTLKKLNQELFEDNLEDKKTKEHQRQRKKKDDEEDDFGVGSPSSRIHRSFDELTEFFKPPNEKIKSDGFINEEKEKTSLVSGIFKMEHV